MSSISGRLQPKSYKALKLRTLDYHMHPRKENIYATNRANSGKGGWGVLSFKIHDVLQLLPRLFYYDIAPDSNPAPNVLYALPQHYFF